jgi:hypothetical protein
MRISGLAWLFGPTMFLAALLLFSVQPMIGKMVLPILGGTPGVWNTCMVFYQAALLAGYTYAHLSTNWLGFRSQVVIHVLLLGLMFRFLPIVVPANFSTTPSQGIGPAFWLFAVLIASAGFPFFVVATMAPLLQRWFSYSGHAGSSDPYFLYAASNGGSLLGLLLYPSVIEPSWTLSHQGVLWAGGCALLTVLVMACAGAVWRRKRPAIIEDNRAFHVEIDHDTISFRDLAWWVVLAFIPSTWLLAVTTFVSTDLAAIPLLWIIPLAIYLVTYILAFARGAGRWVRAAAASLPLLVVPLVMVLSAGFVQLFWVPLHWLVFFVGALVCHGQLANSRPGARHATAFYLAISVGGVLGGMFGALLAPVIFDRIIEYPLAIILGCLVAPGVSGPMATGSTGLNARLSDLILPAVVFTLTAILVAGGWKVADSVLGTVAMITASGLGIYTCVTGLRRPVRFALTAGGVLLASSLATSPGGRLIHRERDFFGTIRVLHDSEMNVNRLLHGNTLHGQQSLDPQRRDEPSTYFTRSGPIGQLFTAPEPRLTRHGSQVAIVGLGAGTLACYARPGQLWSFYEIDAAVIRIAQDPRYFTYLSDGQARGASIGIELGDARLRLRDAPSNGYELIVLDAFSSDAVPVHLLSREAIQLYRSKLAEGGVLAFNLSNRYLDLEPVIGQQAADSGMVCRICYDVYPTAEEKRAGKQGSIWAIMAVNESDLGHLGTDPRWQAPRIRPGARVWTDDYSDLASYLVLGARKFPDPIAAPVETERETEMDKVPDQSPSKRSNTPPNALGHPLHDRQR